MILVNTYCGTESHHHGDEPGDPEVGPHQASANGWLLQQAGLWAGCN